MQKRRTIFHAYKQEQQMRLVKTTTTAVTKNMHTCKYVCVFVKLMVQYLSSLELSHMTPIRPISLARTVCRYFLITSEVVGSANYGMWRGNSLNAGQKLSICCWLQKFFSILIKFPLLPILVSVCVCVCACVPIDRVQLV